MSTIIGATHAARHEEAVNVSGIASNELRKNEHTSSEMKHTSSVTHEKTNPRLMVSFPCNLGVSRYQKHETDVDFNEPRDHWVAMASAVNI